MHSCAFEKGWKRSIRWTTNHDDYVFRLCTNRKGFLNECVWIPPLLLGDTPFIFCRHRSAVCHYPDLHQRGGLLVTLQNAAGWPDGIIRSSVSHGIPHPGRCFPVHSPICLFPAKSFSSFFTYCVFTALPCMRPWIPAGISHAEVRTLAFVRTVTAGLNKTSFHPFIFNRKTQNGLEVFANTSLQQVISYCAVLRLPPRGQAVVKILSPSFRLLSVCSSPHRTSSCSCQIWGSA